MESLRHIQRYFRWLIKSGGAFSVHSPTLFAMYKTLRNKKLRYSGWENAEKIRRKMKHCDQKLDFKDLGAGNRSGSRVVSRIVKDSSHRRGYYQMLSRLAAYSKAECILELGTSLGIGTLYLQAACPAAKTYTIEGSPAIAAIAAENFSTAGVSPKLICGEFSEVLPGILEADDFRADFVWIDGNHSYSPTLEYFNLCLRKAHEKSIFVFDDIHWSDDMETAWEEIRRHPLVRVSIDFFDCGILLFDPHLAKQHFFLRY